MHVVNTPAKKALNTISARSFLRVGAIALRPPNCIPIDPGLAKPQSAEIVNNIYTKVKLNT